MLLCLGVTLTGLLIWQADVQQLLCAFHEAHPGLLGLAAAIHILSIGGIAWQWQRLGKELRSSCTFSQMIHMNMAGTFFESVTPAMKSGGEVVKAYLLKQRYQWSTAQSVALIGLQKAVSLTTMIAVVTACAVAYLWQYGLSTPQAMVVASNTLILLPLFLVIPAFFIFPGKTQAVIGPLMSRWSWSRRILPHMNNLVLTLQARTGKDKLPTHLLLGLAIWLLFPVKAALIAGALGIEASLVDLTVVTFLAYMVAMIPLTPGGVGTFEGTAVFLLLPLGVPLAQALAFALLLRLATFWLSFGCSALYLGYQVLKSYLPQVSLLATAGDKNSAQ